MNIKSRLFLEKYYLLVLFASSSVGLSPLANLNIPLAVKSYVLMLPIQIFALILTARWIQRKNKRAKFSHPSS